MRQLLCLVALLMLSACGAPAARKDQAENSAWRAAAPRSILVVPVVNKSLDVDAPNYVLATLPIPLAEKGYYVFPVNTTKYVLEQEGMYEGEKIHEQAPAVLARLFDADAVLFVTINRWDAQYVLLTTTVTVEFEYRITGRDGAELWREKRSMRYQPQSNSSGPPLARLVGMLVEAAITRAAPNYMPLTRSAHRSAFAWGDKALPDGPYRPAAQAAESAAGSSR